MSSMASSMAGSSASSMSGSGSTITIAQLLSTMSTGGRVNVWYEVGVSSHMLNGTDFSQLNDMGSGGYHVSQGTPASQPSKGIGTGPLGKDCITYQDTVRRLVSTAISIATGKELFFVAIVKCVEAGAARVQCSARTGATEAAGNVVFSSSDTAANLYATAVTPNGGAEESVTITDPAHSTAWIKRATRYTTGIAPVHKINGVSVTPTFSVATGAAATIEVLVLGHPTVAGGSLYLLGIFEAVTASEEAMINAYVLQQTGL